MAGTGSFGTNGASDKNDGLLPPSLLESASLAAPLDDNSSLLGLQNTLKTPSGGDLLSSELESQKPASTTLDNTANSSTPAVNPFEQSFLFKQQPYTAVKFQQLTPVSQKDKDVLTGSDSNNPLVNSPSNDPLTGVNQQTLTASTQNSQGQTTPTPESRKTNFTIRTEKTITINGGGDLDGEPKDLSDDALVYAGKGFIFNGNLVLPVQRDNALNPKTDSSGKLLLVYNAVAVAPGYTTSIANGSAKQYAPLIPPEVVEQLSITVPAYSDLKQQELSRKIPSGTPTVSFDIRQNPINSSSDWSKKFPPPGTANNPTVVRVTGGGLNIPANVSLNNYVIIVEQGNINFNGRGHNFNHVVLVAESGNINLSSLQARELSAIANGSINMNGNARFAGATLLATGSSSGSITFNGATKNTDASNNVRVVSGGSIIYNGSSDTRGYFMSVGDFIFNGTSTLHGKISAKGDITFNGKTTVIHPDAIPPTITATLANDTAPGGTTNTDRITYDPAITGTVADSSSIVEFRAGLNNTPVANYTNVTAQLKVDGSFTFNRAQLEAIYGGTLPDGVHTLHLVASDLYDNSSNVFDLRFTLDTSVLTPNQLDLSAIDDSGASNTDNITNKNTPNITGNAEAFATVQLFDDNRLVGQTTATNTGAWQVTTSSLSDGNRNLTARATDIAGNVSQLSQPLSVAIDTVAPDAPSNLRLTPMTDTGASNSDLITLNPTPTITGNAEAGSTVQLFKDGQILGTAIASNTGEWQLQVEPLADGVYNFTAIAVDKAGNVSLLSDQLSITIDTTIAAPKDLDLVAHSDSGFNNTDNITNNTTPTITGIADAGTTVQLLSDGQVVGQTTASANGTWSITPFPQTQGVHTLSAIASDIAGNVSAGSVPLQITIDAVLPVLTLTTGVDTAPLTQKSRLVGSVDGTGSAVTSLSYRFNNLAEIPVSFNTQGAFDEQLDFTGVQNGQHTLTITTTDTAGNVTIAQYNVTIALDKDSPAIAASLVRDTAINGTTNADGITFDPTVRGTVSDANRVIEFRARFDNTPIPNFVNVTGLRQADGSFSFDRAQLDAIYGSTLPDGKHVLHLQAIDEYNNVSDIFEVSFTLDTTPPFVKVPDLLETDDTGTNNADNITKNTAPVITGNAEAFAVVELLKNGQSIGQTTADSTGNWLLATSYNADGTYNFTATATDVAGNVSNSSASLQVTIDSALPQLTLQTPVETTPLTPGMRLVGSVNGTGSAIASVEYRFNNLPPVAVPLSTTETFDKELDLTGLGNGEHALTITTTDVAGNTKITQYNVTVAIDKDAPAIAASLVRDTAPGDTTNADNITFDPSISGTVTDANQIVQFRAGFDNAPVANFVNVLPQLQADGSFTFNRNQLEQIYGGLLPDGFHTLRLQAQDQYGNTSSIFDVAFTLDTTTDAPTLNLSATSDSGISNSDRITNDATPTIIGTAEAGATVKLFSSSQLIGQTTAAADGTWLVTTSELAHGIQQLSATVTDIAGNTNTGTALQVTIDTVKPQLNITAPINQSSLQQGAKVSGSVNETLSGVASLVYRFNNNTEVAIAFDATGRFDQELDLAGLNNGSHILAIVATDNAGNVSATQYNVTVITDTVGPAISATLVNDTAPGNTTNKDSITYDPTISGTVSDAHRVIEFRAGFDSTPDVGFISVLADLKPDGTFSFDRTRLEQIYGGTLPDGIRTLHLFARDEYGNNSSIFDFTFNFDTTPPSEPIFNLGVASDSGTLADKKTKFETVTLVGQTEANVSVVLEQTRAVTISDSNGKFTFANVSLAIGDNLFSVRATDIAGNEKTFSTTIYRLSPPTAITLVGNTVAENSAPGTPIGQLSSSDPDAGDSYTYTLADDGGGRFRIVGNELLVANSQLLNFESNSEHSITVRSTDASGLSKTEIFTISVTNVNESPIFTSTPFYTANEGSTYTYNIVTIDPDAGDTRNITTINLPTWLNLVDNGDGTATLSGTPTQGIFNIDLAATDAAGLKGSQSFIISVNPVNSDSPLVEETNFTAKSEVNFTTGATPSFISFKIDPKFDNQDPNSINDAFEVALVDVNGNSLVHTVASGRDAFFNWTEGEEIALGAGTSYDATDRTVSLNLTGITPNTDAKLVFRLVNNDGDTTTSVRISDFVITPAPEGTQLPVQKDFEKQPIQGATPNFNLLSDVSQSVGAEYHRTTFNADTKLLYADIAVRNSGSYSIDAPLLVGITNISDPSVIVRNFDGLTPFGIPYYDFSSLVADSKLDPNELSAQRSLVFYNPLGVQFTYDLVVLAQLNKAPVIETKPNTEIIGSQSYRYDVKATDPNSDVLTYKLLVSPEGMTIDEKTGVITWDTAATNKGNHAVYLEVSDSRGGVTEQQWTLSVIDAPPNRPPIFTSTPVVDAAINTPYQYDADAIDPDADNLSYKLALGPEGMIVDPTTGEVKWTPPSVMVFGDTVLGRINNPGEQDAFTFSMVSGQRIYFDSLKFSGNYWEWAVRIYSPSGQLVVNSDARYEGPLNLTETGNYRLVIDGNGSATGDYGFSLLDLDVVPIAPMDSNETGVLNPGSEDDVYRFTGIAGQRLYFDRLSNNTNLDWVIYDAGNQVILSNNWNDMEIDLPVNGEYILALRGRDNINRNVPYTFRIITPNTNYSSLELGSNNNPYIVSDKISEKGEQDVYTFTGSIGQRLSFDTITNGNYTTRAYLYSPSGITIFNRDLSEHNVGPFTLTENGTYRLVMDGNGESTDAYSFSMLNVSSSPVIELDTEKSDRLDPGQRTHFYQFEGSANQRLFFDSLKDVPNTYWDLVGPGNQLLYNTNMSSDFEVTLSSTGTYTLAIYGFNGSPVDYQFQIITPDTNTASLTLGSNDTPHIISNAISEKGEQDVYTFTGSIGQRLSFDTITNGNYTTRAYLYSPSGIT
ncbi:Ig-like domain-containing protein, partial [Scytonema sp. NUACC21]